MPAYPPDDDDSPAPRRPRDDEDDDRPRRRRRRDPDDSERPAKSGGSRTLLITLLAVAGGGLFLCCGGVGACVYLMPKPVTILDATRSKSPDGGTAGVTANVRIGSSGPGPGVRGDYVFMFKAGGRTSVHGIGLRGQGGGEFRSTFATPELAKEAGPVEFWVERRDGDNVTRASEVRTIP